MKKSICIEKIFLEVDFYDRFKCVRDAGFDYVEFWSWESKDLKKINELCKQYNLKIASISGDKLYSPIIFEERQLYLDYLARSIEAAKFMNVKFLVIHSNAINEFGKISNPANDISYTKKVVTLTSTLIEAAKMAEESDVVLVIESLNTFTQPGNFLTRTEDSGDIVNVINSPNLKILYDIWHMQQMEGNIVYYLTKYSNVLGYIHIADNPGRHEPGTGEINFDIVKRTLDELDYDGFFGFELVPTSTSKKAAASIKLF